MDASARESLLRQHEAFAFFADSVGDRDAAVFKLDLCVAAGAELARIGMRHGGHIADDVHARRAAWDDHH